MLLCKYGIELLSLSVEDIERVRVWRNAPHVRMQMSFKEIISAEMQQQWFSSLKKSENAYFIISREGKKAGLVNLKNIDRINKMAEAGIFIGETDFLNSVLPVLATVCIMEFAFEVLKLKRLKAKIGTENANAVLFNQSIGYRKTSEATEPGFAYYETNEHEFSESTRNIRDFLNKLNVNAVLNLSSEEAACYGIDVENAGMPVRVV